METIDLYGPERARLPEASIQDMLQKGVLVNGDAIRHLNSELSRLTGASAFAVSNGTAALHLALRALRLPPNTEILTSPVSFIASTNVIIQEGHIPVFGKVDGSLQLDLADAIRIFEKRSTIKALLIPHIYGLFPHQGALQTIRERFPDIRIIEDCAQALPVDPVNQRIAYESDVATLSFHENKMVSTLGEGGAVVTANQQIYDDAFSRHEHGRSNHASWIDHTLLGYNYRMTEIQALGGLNALESLERIVARRKSLADSYMHVFSHVEGVAAMPDTSENRSWFGYYLILDTVSDASLLSRSLKQHGIGSRVNPFPPIYKFNHVRTSRHIVLDERTADIIERSIALPFRSELDDEDYLSRVRAAVKDYSDARHS